METASAAKAQVPGGIEDVMRSVRELARSTRNVGLDAGHVIERELAMVIGISERIRDATLSHEILHKARSQPLSAALRRDAHRAVDLVADAATVAYVSAADFLEALVDERRPALSRSTAAA